MKQEISIISRDYWFKIVGMLQQKWALIDAGASENAVIYFLNDAGDVFDTLTYPNLLTAHQQALQRNGFNRFDEDKEAQRFISCPAPPFFRHPHPNGPIYSLGQYWH